MKPRDPRPFVRSSPDAPPRPAGHPTLGVPVAAYLYTDERGAPSLFVQRFEFPDATKKKGKRKIFIQWSLRQDANGLEWIDEGFPDDQQLPLYNLPEIKASAPGTLIVLVEGEKKVEPARVIFGDAAIVTTAAMGAGSFLRTNATPLAGHPILVSPDNDAAGQDYVRTVTGVLHKLGCAIRVVDVAELVKVDGGARGVTHDPVGWDCADAVVEWNDLAALRDATLRLAKPFEDEGGEAPETTASSAPRWGDDEREIIAKLSRGDAADFLARAKTDPGFPFEPQAIDALNKFATDRPADWQRLVAQLKTERKVRLSALEIAMKAAILNDSDGVDGLPGRSLTYDEIEPWPSPVDGAELLTQLSAAIGAYVVMDQHQRDATTLWVAFTHAHDLCDYAPLLVVKSPVRRCGKTKLQETLGLLVPRPQPTSGITAATLPRLVEKHRPTLLIDEYDAQAAGDREMAESLRGQLNSSFNKRSAVILKAVPLPGGGWEPRRFSTWAPTCVAGIGKQSDTVEDRSVIIRLARKSPGVKVRRLRGKDGGELIVLARKLARFVSDNEGAIRGAEPKIPDALNDRQQDAWTPLCAIADLAGDEWSKRVRAAAKTLCSVDDQEAVEGDIKTVLLADIRDIFAEMFPAGHPVHEATRAGRPDDGPRLATKRLLKELLKLEERPWSAFGKSKGPLTDIGLARLLRDYQIRSSTVRTVDDEGDLQRGKGYFLRSFEDAFSRYLPPPPSPTRTGVTNAGNAGENEVFEDVPYYDWHESENPENASNSGVCHGWEDQKGGIRGCEKKREELSPDETLQYEPSNDAHRKTSPDGVSDPDFLEKVRIKAKPVQDGDTGGVQWVQDDTVQSVQDDYTDYTPGDNGDDLPPTPLWRGKV